MLSISKSSKTIKSIKSINKRNILGFVLTLFRFLKEKDMCFLSGSIVFEDDNNKLFNLLTYGKLGETGDICFPEEALSYPHITLTHKEVFKKPDVKVVESDEKCIKLKMVQKSLSTINDCKDGRCYKLELVFKKPINYLCGDDDGNKANKSPKQIILYYRFEYRGKKYLFFKLEGHPINSVAHLGRYVYKSRKDTYDKRRENDIIYEEIDKRKDLKFYISLLINELKDLTDDKKKEIYINIINNYNPLLRTGRELFIFEELKEFLIDELLIFYLKKMK